MVDWVFMMFVRSCLWLRYRVKAIGLAAIAGRGKKGILFLPNHPALIDPIIMMSNLYPRFQSHPVADENEVDIFFVRTLARQCGALTIPDPANSGQAGRDRVEQVVKDAAKLLQQGQNILMYPAGQLCKTQMEDLGAASAVHTILNEYPDVRIVLVRTRGLWGSSFGWASGKPPRTGEVLRKGVRALLASALFFAPRRKVTIEFHEPDDFPRQADCDTANRYMEEFYNENPPPNTYVPYTPWKGFAPQRRDEPVCLTIEGSVEEVPDTTQRIATEYLIELSGVKRIDADSRLAHDLGMDSLARADLSIWLEKEFGFPCPDTAALNTVGDVMLAACGRAVSAGPAHLDPVDRRWFIDGDSVNRVAAPQEATITEAFLACARSRPGDVVIADQTSGTKTFRDIVMGVMALKDAIAALPGEHVGIMLPSSVTCDVVFLATLFAGKTPVMVNWTVGLRNMVHCLDVAGVRKVLTSSVLVKRLEVQGVDLSGIAEKIVALESMASDITLCHKLRCWLASRLNWSSLHKARVREVAVVLFTSGSESLPKAVPLTHKNIMTNIGDVLSQIAIPDNDRLLAILPPFHSFGLVASTLLSLCSGLKVVHHTNPTEAAVIGKIIETYRVTLLMGTPTFVSGIARASTSEQLETLRLVVTGAEKCSDRIHAQLRDKCGQAKIIEGYGITECSPVVAMNLDEDSRLGTIGQVLKSLKYAIVEVESDQPKRVELGQKGMLLVQGASVFGGYLGDAKSPFVEFDGEQWYRTGDLVSEDTDGFLTFCGRLKRFVKLGGEMISLPAIEAVVEGLFSPDERDAAEGPLFAVTATSDIEHPQIVMFSTLGRDREQVNEHIRGSGLSSLHTIRRVIHTEKMPVLGTGKTDYRSLAEMLES